MHEHTSSDRLERFSCPLFLACLRRASETPLAAACSKPGLGRLPPRPLDLCIASTGMTSGSVIIFRDYGFLFRAHHTMCSIWKNVLYLEVVCSCIQRCMYIICISYCNSTLSTCSISHQDKADNTCISHTVKRGREGERENCVT